MAVLSTPAKMNETARWIKRLSRPCSRDPHVTKPEDTFGWKFPSSAPACPAFYRFTAAARYRAPPAGELGIARHIAHSVCVESMKWNTHRRM